MITTLSVGFKLYRSDSNEPPIDWDSQFINPAYSYNGRIKNMASNFFFTDNIESARLIGKTYEKGCHFLTECEIAIPEFKIIDFSNCLSVYMMIEILESLNIDVLNADFKFYIEQKEPFESDFEELATHYLAAKEGNMNSLFKLKIPGLTVRDTGQFGQRFTDFENGLAFKKLIDALPYPIHGYRWREDKDPDGLSYCIFKSAYISAPIRVQEDLA
jgi:hypothetical protein